MNEAILNWISGSLAPEDCQTLSELAADIPANGSILDLNCGRGRSTIFMALALRTNVTITAIDSHITNPLSDSPYQEGSLLAFLGILRRCKVACRVIPIVAPVHMVDKVVNKRSHNLVVVQSPATITPSLNEDVMVRSIELAKYAIRRGGVVVVCCPNPVYRPVFDRMIDQQFRGMEQVCASAGLVGFRYDE
jgi:hypothetical protein